MALITGMIFNARASSLYATPQDEAIGKQIIKFAGTDVPICLSVYAGRPTEIDNLPCTQDELRQRLASFARASPLQPVLIVAGDGVPAARIRAAKKLCREAGLTRVLRIKRLPKSNGPAPIMVP